MKEETTMPKDDPMPLLEVKSKSSGIIYVPLWEKNTKGEWELANKSFQKMILDQYGSGHHALEEK